MPRKEPRLLFEDGNENLGNKVALALKGVAHLAGCCPVRRKVRLLVMSYRHMPGLQARCPVGAQSRGNRLMFLLSH